MLEHMNAVLALTEEALEKEPTDPTDEKEQLKQQLLKTKLEMAFNQDDKELQKEVAIHLGKEMP